MGLLNGLKRIWNPELPRSEAIAIRREVAFLRKAMQRETQCEACYGTGWTEQDNEKRMKLPLGEATCPECGGDGLSGGGGGRGACVRCHWVPAS